MTGRITDLSAAAALTGAELVEVSQLDDTTQIVATTISAAAADNSFNDSANGLVAAGFAEGDRVNVDGFTGNVANNILVGTIETLTAGKMIIASPEGDVLVDDAAGESVTITKWVSARTTTQDIADLGGGGGGSGTMSMTVALSDLTSDLTTGPDAAYWDPPFPITISSVSAAVFEAPTGAGIQIDINEGGASILSTKITIDDGEVRSADSAVPPVVSDPAVAGRLTFDIDTIGSGATGKGVQVTIVYTET